MDSPHPIPHPSTQTFSASPAPPSPKSSDPPTANDHSSTHTRSISGATATTTIPTHPAAYRPSLSFNPKTRSPSTRTSPRSGASFTIHDIRTFVHTYLQIQYSRTLLLTTLFRAPTRPKPGGKYSPPKWEHWLRLALFYKLPGPSPGMCRDLRVLRGVLERQGLDMGLLDPLLANLRDGEGCFRRTAGSHAHGLLVRQGRVQDLAATLFAERMLVEALWPLRGDYYDVMDEALVCFGTVALMPRDFVEQSDRRGARVHRWVYDETVRWFSELDSPTEFRLNASARKMAMRGRGSDVARGDGEKLAREKSVTSAQSQALREALVRTAEIQRRGRENEKDVEDDTDVHPIFRASSPPPETIASRDGNLDPRLQTASHRFTVRIPVPITALWEGVPVSTLPIEATRMHRCFCGCLHEISLSIDMPPMSAELEQGCLKMQNGTGKFVRRTGSGRHVLAKRNSLISAVRSLKGVSSMGSLRRFAGSPLTLRTERRGVSFDEEVKEIAGDDSEDSGVEGEGRH